METAHIITTPALILSQSGQEYNLEVGRAVAFPAVVFIAERVSIDRKENSFRGSKVLAMAIEIDAGNGDILEENVVWRAVLLLLASRKPVSRKRCWRFEC